MEPSFGNFNTRHLTLNDSFELRLLVFTFSRDRYQVNIKWLQHRCVYRTLPQTEITEQFLPKPKSILLPDLILKSAIIISRSRLTILEYCNPNILQSCLIRTLARS